jgi:hypothetical protein
MIAFKPKYSLIMVPRPLNGGVAPTAVIVPAAKLPILRRRKVRKTSVALIGIFANA